MVSPNARRIKWFIDRLEAYLRLAPNLDLEIKIFIGCRVGVWGCQWQLKVVIIKIVSHAKDEFQEESDEWKQPSVKPPRHFSVDQHSISSDTLLVSADLVFDGHGGTDAASFVRNNILKFIIEDSCFPICLEKAMKNAFLKADYAFVDDSSVDTSSGTTALTALLCERNNDNSTLLVTEKLVIANAGDCGAVLGKRGRAIELSKDHKPDSKP
nr:probable protein phosphatase 2C 27 isoform X3 [Ipomoea trifida]